MALALLVSLGLMLVGQGVLVFGFVRGLRNWHRPRLVDQRCPKAAVVLCLRGTDPYLRDCILALIEQDYPDYLVKIIVDREADPAWDVVQQVLADSPRTNVQVEALEKPLATCSLKCSSLVQAVSGLDESYEFVAQLDADTVPHTTWLRELAAPLTKDGVGAATGNRWYMPERPTHGTMVRYLWNACAIIQMYWYRIAWGGTLAVKTDVIRKCGLLDRWSNAFCEDTMLYSALRKEKLRVEFVPSLMMVNRETCDLPGFFHWVARQLLTARLYHPKFSSVIAHGVMVTVVSATTIAMVLYAAIQRNWTIALSVAGAWLFYELVLTLFIFPMETAVRRIVAGRGQPTQWVTPATVVEGLIGVLSLQIIYPAALFWAIVARTVTWRGVAYRIGGSRAIEMVQYQPYTQVDGEEGKASL